MAELDDVPTGELPELMDMLVWNGAGGNRDQVAVWHAELIARPDCDAPHVRLAADVCMEFLAKPGSAFERVIGARVAAGFDNLS